jgi:hypothetical protein
MDCWPGLEFGLAPKAPGLGEAPGDEDVPDASSSPGAFGAEVEVPLDCVADVAAPGAGALVHPVTASAARTARAAVAPARVVLEPFISGYPMIARYGHAQCRVGARG